MLKDTLGWGFLLWLIGYALGMILFSIVPHSLIGWIIMPIGAIIIASPFPDELGVSLIGLSKLSTGKFILLSYILNSIGIFLVVSASVFIKP